MIKPTREEAKKQLKALDRMQEWLEQNLDYVMELEEDDDEGDNPDNVPVEFDKDSLESDFENIRASLRFCL
jgi:hypothetical protein